MKKPEKWYGFRVNCDLHDFGMSNMTAPEKQQYCKRADRHGNFRPDCDSLKCHWNVCPKLKEQRAKKNKSLLKKKSILKSNVSKASGHKLKALEEMENSKGTLAKCRMCGKKPETYEGSWPWWSIYCIQETHTIEAKAKTVKAAIKRWNKINETV